MADFISPMQNPASAAAGNTPGAQAYAVAQQQLGKPYVYGATGPDSFDCSGLMYYSYLHGPNINVGRDTTSEWNNTTSLTTVYDATNQSGITADTLQVGDLLLYFQPGNSGPNAHVKMYAGGGQTIEAPHTGAVVEMNPVDLQGDSSEPFRGVKRPTGEGGGAGGGGAGGGGGGSGQGSGSGNQPTGSYWSSLVDSIQSTLSNMKDPVDNLPFSSYFQGQIVPGLSGGDFAVPGLGPTPSFRPLTQLVRGGMAEIVAKKFKCYFMMNPQQISVSAGINTDMLSPFQQTSDFWKSGGYWVSNQTISFTLYFNRMYEVWQGNLHGGTNGSGPSDEGCRWDIRALERLMGLFDARVTDPGGITGLGNNGWGQYPASQLPLQVVFGGPNSIQFQGVISQFDYTFTLFDANMIPVEAMAEVEVMRLYQPQVSRQDIVSSLVTTTGQVGPQTLPTKQPFTA